ncbi:MAG: type IV secretion system DotC family protein [Azoarcus sp.]|jgi:defect-in-organelle-trafficking protein DotC|nr:type IV secretion system DotC family protein [Azoarcus sp.]
MFPSAYRCLAFASVASALLCMAGSSAATPEPATRLMTLEQAQSLYKNTKSSEDDAPDTAVQHQKNVAAQARIQALFDAAFNLGVKGGLSWQLAVINRSINKRTREFDTIYDFSRLMVRDLVVPPVITEARDLYHQDGDKSLRLSGAYYRIESQAKFASNAPNWREYLMFPSADSPSKETFLTMKPRSDSEEQLWRAAVSDGWQQGIEQANLLLRNGLDRLNRDFTGMLRFHTFVIQGKITLPVIASERIPVTKKGDTMAIDEKLLRISKLPDFEENMSKWRSVIRPAQGF